VKAVGKDRMSRFELRDYQITERIRRSIVKYPKSVIAIAYRMGLKDKEVQLQPEIGKLLRDTVESKNRLPGM